MSKNAKQAARAALEPQAGASASLGGTTSTPEPTASSGPAWVIYSGRTGADEEFAHEGSWTAIAPGAKKPITFMRGLNIFEGGLWDVSKGHGPIAARMTTEGEHGQQLTITSMEKLRGGSRHAFAALAARTEQPQALAALLEIESSRPLDGGRKVRRDPDVEDAIKRRLSASRRRRVFSLDGILEQAASLAETGKAEKAKA